MMIYNKAYGIADFIISPSFPCMSHEAVAMAILCGEIILPPVAPVVFAATSQLLSPEPNGNPICAPTLACNLANKILEEVSLPVSVSNLSNHSRMVHDGCQ